MYISVPFPTFASREERKGWRGRTRVAISRSKGFEIKERKKEKRKSCCSIVAWTRGYFSRALIYHARERDSAFHALVESAFTSVSRLVAPSSSIIVPASRLGNWFPVSRAPPPNRPFASPLSLSPQSSSSPPRLVFLIKCKYANGKTCTHLSRSLIVMLSILTERERFRKEFLFYRSQIGFKNGCHNAFQKEKIVKKCSLNKWLNKFLGTTMVNNNSSSPYGGMANVRA